MEWLIVLITALALVVAYMYFELRDTREDLDMALEAMLELQVKHNQNAEISSDMYEKLLKVNKEYVKIGVTLEDEKFQHFLKNYEFYKEMLEERDNNVLPEVSE